MWAPWSAGVNVFFWSAQTIECQWQQNRATNNSGGFEFRVWNCTGDCFTFWRHVRHTITNSRYSVQGTVSSEENANCKTAKRNVTLATKLSRLGTCVAQTLNVRWATFGRLLCGTRSQWRFFSSVVTRSCFHEASAGFRNTLVAADSVIVVQRQQLLDSPIKTELYSDAIIAAVLCPLKVIAKCCAADPSNCSSWWPSVNIPLHADFRVYRKMPTSRHDISANPVGDGVQLMLL